MDIAKQMMNVYKLGNEERIRRGLVGREWAMNNGFTSKAMCDDFEKAVDICFETWTPRKRFTLVNTDRPTIDYPEGIIFNTIELGEIA